MTEWHSMTEALQLQLADQAMREAAARIAAFAEGLAAEMGVGAVADRGGQEALTLFAAMVRSMARPGLAAGSA